MRKETWAEVSLNKLKDNHQILSDEINGRTVFPVVKANAYGHGMVEIARKFEEMGVPLLCVSSIEEAQELVKANIKTDILIFGKTDFKSIASFNHPQFIYTIPSFEWLRHVDTKLRLHLEINTGMNRMGIKEKDLILEVIKKHQVEGIYTHFASNQQSKHTDKQRDNFKKVLSALNCKEIKWIHVGNVPLSYLPQLKEVNAIRFGLSLYGYHPDLELKPILSLFSQITHADWLEKNETVGYDFDYIATSNGYFATVPIGYADGFDQKQKEVPVIINGKRYPIVGKICMDQLMIVSNERLEVEDKVELISENRKLKQISEITGLSIYEYLSRLPERLKRIYIETT